MDSRRTPSMRHERSVKLILFQHLCAKVKLSREIKIIASHLCHCHKDKASTSGVSLLLFSFLGAYSNYKTSLKATDKSLWVESPYLTI